MDAENEAILYKYGWLFWVVLYLNFQGCNIYPLIRGIQQLGMIPIPKFQQSSPRFQFPNWKEGANVGKFSSKKKFRVVSSMMTGWWFQIFFIFIPIWGNDPIWRAYFSDGLVQPPTRWHFPSTKTEWDRIPTDPVQLRSSYDRYAANQGPMGPVAPSFA